MAAIRWGTMAAKTGPGVPAFWMGAHIAEEYLRQVPEANRDFTVHGFVQAHLDLASAGVFTSCQRIAMYWDGDTETTALRGSTFEAASAIAVDPMSEGVAFAGGDGDELGDGYKPGSGGGSSGTGQNRLDRQPLPRRRTATTDGGMCCVKKFEFAKDDTYRRRSARNITGREEGVLQQVQIGIGYRVEAVFDEGGNCECACCEFRQVILENTVVIESHRPERVGSTRSERREPTGTDCFYVVTYADGSKENIAHPGESSPGPGVHQAAKGEPVSVDGPFCAGERAGNPPEFPRDDKEPGDVRGRYSADGCRFSWLDTPDAVVDVGKYFTWTWRVRGIIHDACHLNAIRSQKEWQAVVSGRVSEGGETVRFDADPSATGPDDFPVPPRAR